MEDCEDWFVINTNLSRGWYEKRRLTLSVYQSTYCSNLYSVDKEKYVKMRQQQKIVNKCKGFI